MPQCPGCQRVLTFTGLSNHLRQTTTPACAAEYQRINSLMPGILAAGNGDEAVVDDHSDEEEEEEEAGDIPEVVFGGSLLDDNDPGEEMEMEMEMKAAGGPPPSDDGDDGDEEEDEDEEDDDPVDYEDPQPWEPAPAAAQPANLDEDEAPGEQPIPPPPGRGHVEDALRQEVHVEHFLGSADAQDNPYAPFLSQREWLIARWAKLRGPGSTSLDELLGIDGVAEDLGLSFDNSRELNKIIDKQLPPGRPRFRCKEVVVDGEAFEVYYRDALECVKALFGDPNFAADLVFKPERHYLDANRTDRVYHEMHTGRWWWDTQKELEAKKKGATVVPVIISSDKTRLTKFKGKSAYPVYLTIGNIPKEIRRKPSMQSQILLAYLPTTRLEHITVTAARRRAVANLFHTCMGRILEPLRTAGLDGVEMASGDGVVRRCHPIFAAHVGDYPEQCLVTGVYGGQCPCCTVPAKELGDHGPSGATHPFRDLEAILDALTTVDHAARMRACKAVGIKPILPRPYWQDLPYADVFLSITPDILHQLYQGVIKHLVNWIKTAYSVNEIDARARRLPRGHHVRVFTKGISSLYQLTGREHADIARIILGLIADMPLPDGASPLRLVRAVRGLLDFLYLAQYPVHTTATLNLLNGALDRFHDNKDIFIDLGIRADWCIPKLHFLRHYVYLIKRLGTTDNFNTEYTERLHIDLAKDAYEATNSKDEFPQMTRWLERREKIFRHERYIAWRLAGSPPMLGSHLAQADAAHPPDHLKMTKHPSKKTVRMEALVADYGATFFEDAIARYAVQYCHPEYSRAQIERAAMDIVVPCRSFPVYHKAKFWLGDAHNHRLSSNEWDVVHATPSRHDTRGRPVDGQFDTVIVNDGHGQYSGVDGYRIAQVRVIFSLPPRAAPLFATANQAPPKFLAYVEWFTAFTVADPHHRLYKLKRLLRNGDRQASIIPLRSVRRSAYLFPVFGAIAPRDWTSGTVLDKCTSFYVDSFSDRHAYHTIH
ncbi:hypothetical protein EUX98_g9024 [Antrodiella citrinella]|uniref:Uncharacterized protein n=1 Tax=Antrodiella citrinella TaxID=2447956 RepID=A0A4S4M1H4_9APHY|nr:hypothetical protein EUX98_g9024 [Antrodiella citrinella]